MARIAETRMFAKAIEIDFGYRFNNYGNNNHRFYFNINIDIIGASLSSIITLPYLLDFIGIEDLNLGILP